MVLFRPSRLTSLASTNSECVRKPQGRSRSQCRVLSGPLDVRGATTYTGNHRCVSPPCRPFDSTYLLSRVFLVSPHFSQGHGLQVVKWTLGPSGRISVCCLALSYHCAQLPVCNSPQCFSEFFHILAVSDFSLSFRMKSKCHINRQVRLSSIH